MLSYKTIVALHIISLLLNAGKKGLTFSELQIYLGREHSLGVRHTLTILVRNNWVKMTYGKHYQHVADPRTKSLLDLVMTTDGQLQLDTHVRIGFNNTGLLSLVEINRMLVEMVSKRINEIRITDIMESEHKINNNGNI